MKTIPVAAFVMSDPSYPVIRLDFKGRILYANRASFPILREWNCLANDYLPEELVHQFPSVLDMDAAFDFQINTNESAYFLDVIGFKESGYVGLYGFKTESKPNSSPRRNALTAQY
jgi:hypothetical protein